MSSDSNRNPDPRDPRVMTGKVWQQFCETLQRAGRLALGEGVPDSPLDRAEGLRYLTRFLAAGNVQCIEHADPDYPEFGRMMDHTMAWGLDCPDCLYLYAPVRGDASYRIWGTRGSANHLDMQVNYGHFSDGDIASWGTISSLSGFELEADSEGRFELVLSPDERKGNWLRIEPGAEFVLIRQYFNDWENERPADLLIERIGAQYPVPPTRTDQMADRLERLCRWLERGGALWETMSKALHDLPPNTLNVTLPLDGDVRAGLRGQAYGMGNFRCAPDQAVIVEFEPPRCHHWSFSLANWYWESLDFASRQSSLNGHQAQLDESGVFHGVIAHRDPGVPNWLDTGGHQHGTVAARFLLAESATEPKLRSVKFADVLAELPADMPRIDPATRTEIIERRRHAVWRRYRR